MTVSWRASLAPAWSRQRVGEPGPRPATSPCCGNVDGTVGRTSPHRARDVTRRCHSPRAHNFNVREPVRIAGHPGVAGVPRTESRGPAAPGCPSRGFGGRPEPPIYSNWPGPPPRRGPEVDDMTRRPGSLRYPFPTAWGRVVVGAVAGALAGLLAVTGALAAPKVVIISLDGATPRFVDQYLATGVLGPNEGLGLLKRVGIHAEQNVTISPSLTAPGHIAIATGSTAAAQRHRRQHVPSRREPVRLQRQRIRRADRRLFDRRPRGQSTSRPPSRSGSRCAKPAASRRRGDVSGRRRSRHPDARPAPTAPSSSRAAERTVDYTVPFGAFAGIGAQGFSLTAANFAPAPAATVSSSLPRAGRSSAPCCRRRRRSRPSRVGGVSVRHPGRRARHDQRRARSTTTRWCSSMRDQGILPGPFAPPVDRARVRRARPTAAPAASSSRAAATRRGPAST